MAATKRQTLRDVARLAGVSTATASMALADRGRVAQETKQRVAQAALELGYVPHSAGRSLRTQQVGAVAVVVPHSTSHVFSHPTLLSLLEGITAVANDHDLATILSTSRVEDDEESAYLKLLKGRRADGVIVAAAAATDLHAAQLARAGYPVVVVGRAPLLPDVGSVGVDDIGGAHRAVRHLIEVHGAERIAHISGPLQHQSAIDKRDGYVAALREAGLTLDPREQFEGDYSEQSGWDAAEGLLSAGRRFSALFCANDQMAMGALAVLRAAGMDVPGDVALVGYDDHPLVRYAQPPLTTVASDMVAVGGRAMSRLMDLLGADGADPTHDVLPAELVVRESCGCSVRP
jgi:DNA-binding LacI/PurR family transcriptional regulator